MNIAFFVVHDSPRPAEAAALNTDRGPAFIEYDPTPEAMLATVRTPLDALWVDLAVLHGDSRALKQLRLKRPELRILVGYDADLTPPNPLMAQLVALGIYDLIPSSQSLDSALAHRANIADAARWQLEQDALLPESGSTADPFLSPAARRRTLWRSHLTPAAEEETRPAASIRIVRPPRLLIVGSHGGVGTSSLVAAIGRAWHRDGVPVALVDAARHGGWLPLAWAGDPIAIGWDGGLKPAAAWRSLDRDLYLLAQSGPERTFPPTPDDSDRLIAALRQAPTPAGAGWLIDGGSDWGWSEGLADWLDALVLVTTADPVGVQCGARALNILRAASVPILGLVVNRRTAGQPAGKDIAAAHGVPCMADWSERGDVWQALWQGRGGPESAAWLRDVANRLLDAQQRPVHTMKG